MVVSEKKKILRVLDVNFNRAKEGLRICEDVTRFIFDRKKETLAYKNIRHQLTELLSEMKSAKKN
jgi:thiamine-phosphate pyrophosphorylase